MKGLKEKQSDVQKWLRCRASGANIPLINSAGTHSPLRQLFVRARKVIGRISSPFAPSMLNFTTALGLVVLFWGMAHFMASVQIATQTIETAKLQRQIDRFKDGHKALLDQEERQFATGSVFSGPSISVATASSKTGEKWQEQIGTNFAGVLLYRFRPGSLNKTLPGREVFRSIDRFYPLHVERHGQALYAVLDR